MPCRVVATAMWLSTCQGLYTAFKFKALLIIREVILDLSNGVG
jgi:hypothetical protein